MTAVAMAEHVVKFPGFWKIRKLGGEAGHKRGTVKRSCLGQSGGGKVARLRFMAQESERAGQPEAALG